MESDSHYHRQPGVSPARISVYPKRRLSDLPSGLRTIPPETPIRLPGDYSATYFDFFQHGTVTSMSTFSHIVDNVVESFQAGESFDAEAQGA